MPTPQLELSDLPPDYRAQAERQLAAGRGRAAPKPVETRPKLRADSPKSELEEAFVTELRRHASYLPAPRRQYLFAAVEHPTLRPRQWAFDFAWPAERVAVEADGGTRIVRKGKGGGLLVGGRHNGDEDRWKLADAAARGWVVIRFTPTMLNRDPLRLLKLVACAIAERRSGR